MHRVKLGFSPAQDRDDPFSLMSKYFPEEFLGRLDEIIIFRTPTVQEFRKILSQKLTEALGRLQDKGVFLVYEPERLLDHLLAGDEKPWGGARDMARLVERRLIQPIARRLLDLDAGEWVCIELTESFYRFGDIDPVPLTRHHRPVGPPPGFSGRSDAAPEARQ